MLAIGTILALFSVNAPAIDVRSSARCATAQDVAGVLSELVPDPKAGAGHVAVISDAGATGAPGRTNLTLQVTNQEGAVVLDRAINDLACAEAPRTAAT